MAKKEETRIRVDDADRPLDRDPEVGDGSGPVHVRDEGISVNDTMSVPAGRMQDAGLVEAHRRFGGLDVPATLVGMLTALALVAILGGLIGAAIGAIGYQTGTEGNEQELSIASLAGGIVTLFLAFLIGGWAAGRIARYDGPTNGLMTGVWTIVLGAVLSGLAAWLGSEYDVFRNLNMPQWLSQDALTAGAIASGIAAAAAMLLGGWLGGRWGERYHRRADAAIVGAREGALRTSDRELVIR
jgi:hypothetical protein